MMLIMICIRLGPLVPVANVQPIYKNLQSYQLHLGLQIKNFLDEQDLNICI